MRYYDEDEAKKIDAQDWMIKAMEKNPEYVSWGPDEDCMCDRDSGWTSSQSYDDWESFGPWELDDLNECVNFYFAIERDQEECPSCGGSSYNPETAKIAREWYSFENRSLAWHDKLNQAEVDALWEEKRLRPYFKEKPSAEEVNAWEKSGLSLGHDAINRLICVRARAKHHGVWGYCPECEGDGYIYTVPEAKLSLFVWMIHPRKGAARGVEVKSIREDELESVYEWLRAAAKRNQDRFGKI